MNYFLNLDFLYYVIYLFFRSIWNFFAGIFGFQTSGPKNDLDEDGIPDEIDDDADGDGVVDAGKSDFDGDGIIDRVDSDVDGDGVIDNPPDINNNGINDNYESLYESSDFNILDLINYFTGSDYSVSGNGIGALYDGYSMFTPPHGFSSWGSGFFDGFSNWMGNFLTNPYCNSCSSFFDLIFGGINSLFWALSLLFLLLFLFLREKEEELKDLDWEKYEQVFEKEDVASGNRKTERWEKILKLVESENVNDWKAAIIDSDNLLDEILLEQGYTGKTLGERLKSADFDTVQNAWEAHRVRNSIAHDPHFNLTKRETKRVVQNYSLVFNEFYYL